MSKSRWYDGKTLQDKLIIFAVRVAFILASFGLAYLVREAFPSTQVYVEDSYHGEE